MQKVVRISKALTDENRIRMLKLLLERDICVCEMQEILQISQPQVSRNLKILMDAGFLKRWREGKSIVYVVERNNSDRFCKAMLDALAESFNDDTAVSRDRKKLQQVIEQQLRQTA